MLCTFGFVDDVIFHVMAVRRVMFIPNFLSAERTRQVGYITAEIPTRFYSTIKTGSSYCELRTGAKSDSVRYITCWQVFGAGQRYAGSSPGDAT